MDAGSRWDVSVGGRRCLGDGPSVSRGYRGLEDMMGVGLFVVEGSGSEFVDLLWCFVVMGDEFCWLLGPSRCWSSEIIRVRPLGGG